MSRPDVVPILVEQVNPLVNVVVELLEARACWEVLQFGPAHDLQQDVRALVLCEELPPKL